MTTAEVDAEIADGARTVRALRNATGAGASCGSCVKRLSCLLAAAGPGQTTAPTSAPAAQPVLETPIAQPAPAAETPVAEPRWKPRMPIARRPQHQPGCPAAAPALG